MSLPNCKIYGLVALDPENPPTPDNTKRFIRDISRPNSEVYYVGGYEPYSPIYEQMFITDGDTLQDVDACHGAGVVFTVFPRGAGTRKVGITGYWTMTPKELDPENQETLQAAISDYHTRPY